MHYVKEAPLSVSVLELLAFRMAHLEDAGEIADMVNRAYRPEAGQGGWTHDAHLLAGKRTSVPQVLDLLSQRDSEILLSIQFGAIVACVHLETLGEICHFSMLAVRPNLQGLGIGKYLLRQAEHHAAQTMGVTRVNLQVMSMRPELLAFYQRRGFALTGETEHFGLVRNAGEPRVEGLVLMTMEKSVSGKPA